MTTLMNIRNMREDELQIAVDWAKEEGWNPGLHDANLFYLADPKGFFIGEIKDEPVVVACAVNYDDKVAFGGLYIVKKPYRQQGYGMAMTNHCLAYVGTRNVGVDGVLENVPLYEHIGFKFYYKNIRYEHTAVKNPSFDSHIKPLCDIPLEQIFQYDRHCFFAKRDAFLKAWITQPDSIVLGYVVDRKLLGYGVLRKCYRGYKLAPLFADNEEIAEALFLALQSGIQPEPIFIDIPEINQAGKNLVKKYNMKPGFSTARMYNQSLPSIDNNKIIGVTSFEVG